ncbi:hypothetical protein T4B_9736 [Trichinella pseudospiralis]|uniref:Uncharacterized protein n=1 Tax=Trichinella pseudospiralis TaxID=6337 RepID=A0A0V1IHW1_TRIPS|nr:hypothetical protein T4B_9736 [Trichinella pseudospiralis]
MLFGSIHLSLFSKRPTQPTVICSTEKRNTAKPSDCNYILPEQEYEFGLLLQYNDFQEFILSYCTGSENDHDDVRLRSCNYDCDVSVE